MEILTEKGHAHMDRRQFTFSLAVVSLIPLIPPAPHTRVILPKGCRVCELLEHLKQIAGQGHYHDSLEIRLADGRCLALDTSFNRRRVVEYDFTRGRSVKPVFYTETFFLSSSVTPDAYYLFLCSLMYAQKSIWGPVEESKTVTELIDILPTFSANMFANRIENARESLRQTLTEQS